MSSTKTILVQCTYVIPVEVPADIDEETMRRYLENDCPGTGMVGAAFDAHLRKQEKASMCWACTLNGHTKVVPPPPPAPVRHPYVCHFEIHADNPERAMEFYQAVFDWQFKAPAGPIEYWPITAAWNEKWIYGGLIRRTGPPPKDGQPINAFPCTIKVDAIDDVLASIQAAGGTITLAKMLIPGHGWLAYFRDTERNIVGVMQSDPKAK